MLRRDHAGSGQCDIVVKTGDTFVYPKLVGIHFLTQISVNQHIRLDTLNMPGVKQFMTAQTDEINVTVVQLSRLTG